MFSISLLLLKLATPFFSSPLHLLFSYYKKFFASDENAKLDVEEHRRESSCRRLGSVLKIHWLSVARLLNS